MLWLLRTDNKSMLEIFTVPSEPKFITHIIEAIFVVVPVVVVVATGTTTNMASIM